MPNGYVRQSAADITPLTGVRSAPLNAEFNALQSAFDATNGHSHDGTPGGGAPISKFLLGTSSLTAPAGAIAGDTNTGIGQIGGADTISLIAGGTEAIRALTKTNGNAFVTVTPGASAEPEIGTSNYSLILRPYGGNVIVDNAGDVLTRVSLRNSNRYWTISNYSTAQTGNSGALAIADETAGEVRFFIAPAGDVSLAGGPGYESLRAIPVAGANRAITVSGSNSGNPVISTTAGGLDVRAADGNPVVLGAGHSAQYPTQVQIAESTHATSRRSQINFGTAWSMMQDIAGSGVKDFGLYCASLSAWIWQVATNGVSTFLKAVRGGLVTLTDAATITPDFAAGNYFTVTLGGNRTLANPTNLAAGQGGSITIRQDGSGSRTLAFGSYWKFPGGTVPTLSTTANAVDKLVYEVISATEIHATLIKDFK